MHILVYFGRITTNGIMGSNENYKTKMYEYLKVFKGYSCPLNLHQFIS